MCVCFNYFVKYLLVRGGVRERRVCMCECVCDLEQDFVCEGVCGLVGDCPRHYA